MFSDHCQSLELTLNRLCGPFAVKWFIILPCFVLHYERFIQLILRRRSLSYSDNELCIVKVTLPCTGLFKMIIGVLKTCHTQYTWDSSICIFFNLTEQHSKFLLHTLQVFYMCTVCDSTNINTIKREERKPTICNNIDGLLSIMDVGYWQCLNMFRASLCPSSGVNKPSILLHLVGFLSSRFTHDARSQEHKAINTIIDNHRWHATNSLELTRLSCWCL